jgi:hypothetical protein
MANMIARLMDMITAGFDHWLGRGFSTEVDICLLKD